jgi:uncharacterized protein (DUF433 family)
MQVLCGTEIQLRCEIGNTMSSITNYPHITTNEDGSARIGQTRYKVVHLASEHFHYGWSAEELLRQHPDLKPEEVYAALTYFYDHYEQMVTEMSRAADQAERLRVGALSLSRSELLARRNRGPHDREPS